MVSGSVFGRWRLGGKWVCAWWMGNDGVIYVHVSRLYSVGSGRSRVGGKCECAIVYIWW